MLCQHLCVLERELIASGVRETCRGAVWSTNCREWVYFDAVLDIPSLTARLHFPACVEVHENLDPKSGLERGFFCAECFDAVMGLVSGAKIYR